MKNKKNHDGSVNAYQTTGKPGHGYTVDFSDPNFKYEIEEHIFDAVLVLNSKGYKTVTSCHGHSRFAYYFRKGIRYNNGPQVTIEFPYSMKLPNTFFIVTGENTTITSNNKVYHLSIKIRPVLEKLFTNKFLCSILTKYCERIPSVYSIN
jgi:hypothetical protein